MDFNTFDTYQAEIEYREQPDPQGRGAATARRVRVPFVRRPAEATRTSR